MDPDEPIDPLVDEYFRRWETGELSFAPVVLYTDLVNVFKELYPHASVAKFRRGLTLSSDNGRIKKHARHPHKGQGKQTYSLGEYRGPVYFPKSFTTNPRRGPQHVLEDD
jgi:hypothetical protein